MPSSEAKPVSIAIDQTTKISGLLQKAPRPQACFVMAHGAGAGMRHPFMTAVATGLAKRGIATLRYQFSYMERGGKRPDPPKLAQAAVRGAVAEALRLQPGVLLVAGGKSFGGQMTSQAQTVEPLPGVRGLVFLGFPLHPAGRPSNDRADHLHEVRIPMLFLQGKRDALAQLDELKPLCESLGAYATLKFFPDADHSFHVPARSGRTDAQVLNELVEALASWVEELVTAAPSSI